MCGAVGGWLAARFVISRWMDRARDLLRGTEAPVEHVAAGDVGFANLSRFRRVFRAHMGDAVTV